MSLDNISSNDILYLFIGKVNFEYVDATNTSPSDDRHLYQYQISLAPHTLNAHRVSWEGEIEFISSGTFNEIQLSYK